MKINLTADYRGVLTNEAYYKAGIIDVSATVGAALVQHGRATVPDVGQSPLVPDLSPSRKVLASKAVRKKAADNNLLIYSVVGTGKNGRVTMADVEALIA